MDVETSDADTFQLNVSHQDRGGLLFAHLTNTPHINARTAQSIRRDETDTVSVLTINSGRAVLELNDEQVEAGPGDMLLHDLDRPIRCIGIGDELIDWKIMHLRRSLLDAELAAVKNVQGLKLDGNVPANRVLRTYLEALHGNLGTMDVMEARAFEATTTDILRNSLLLNQPRDQTKNGRALQKVQSSILENLHKPDLSLNEVAEQVGIGPRTIHRLFQQTGMTPMKWAEDQRLKLVEHKLRSSAGSQVSITRIALSSGYNDISTFSRSFKRKYGLSPTKYLRTLQQKKCAE
jgi:AraC family transcriptional activator of tynA and feaB